MASPNFTINGSACPPEKAVAYGATITLALSSTSGVNTVAWSISGTSAASLAIPAITPGGSPLGSSATFAAAADPGTGKGISYLVKCVVNGGLDTSGVSDPSLTKTALVGVANPAGIVPVAVGEKGERSSTHGWTEAVNTALANVGTTGPAGAGAPPPNDLVSTSNIASLTGEQTIDGVLTSASRVLLVAQTTASQNGPWITGSPWTRPSDFDADAEVITGQVFYVKSGTLGASTSWQLTSGSTIAGSKTFARVPNGSGRTPVRAVQTGALPAYTYNSGSKTITGNANGALGATVFDGLTTVVGDRVLVVLEGTKNGVYDKTQNGDVSNPFILTRSSDLDASADFANGVQVDVLDGATAGSNNKGTRWYLTTLGAVTLDTTSTTWAPMATRDAKEVDLAKSPYFVKDYPNAAAAYTAWGFGGAGKDPDFGTVISKAIYENPPGTRFRLPNANGGFINCVQPVTCAFFGKANSKTLAGAGPGRTVLYSANGGGYTVNLVTGNPAPVGPTVDTGANGTSLQMWGAVSPAQFNLSHAGMLIGSAWPYTGVDLRSGWTNFEVRMIVRFNSVAGSPEHLVSCAGSRLLGDPRDICFQLLHEAGRINAILRTQDRAAGVYGAITHSGTGASVCTGDATVKPTDDYSFKLLVETGGTVGVAGIFIRHSFDGGTSYSIPNALGTETRYVITTRSQGNTSGSFTQPAVGSTVTVPFGASNGNISAARFLTVGACIRMVTGGDYQVTAVAIVSSVVQVTLKNLGAVNNAAPATVIATGRSFSRIVAQFNFTAASMATGDTYSCASSGVNQSCNLTSPVGSVVANANYVITLNYDGSNARLYVAQVGTTSATGVQTAAMTGRVCQYPWEQTHLGHQVNSGFHENQNSLNTAQFWLGSIRFMGDVWPNPPTHVIAPPTTAESTLATARAAGQQFYWRPNSVECNTARTTGGQLTGPDGRINYYMAELVDNPALIGTAWIPVRGSGGESFQVDFAMENFSVQADANSARSGLFADSPVQSSFRQLTVSGPRDGIEMVGAIFFTEFHSVNANTRACSMCFIKGGLVLFGQTVLDGGEIPIAPGPIGGKHIIFINTETDTVCPGIFDTSGGDTTIYLDDENGFSPDLTELLRVSVIPSESLAIAGLIGSGTMPCPLFAVGSSVFHDYGPLVVDNAQLAVGQSPYIFLSLEGSPLYAQKQVKLGEGVKIKSFGQVQTLLCNRPNRVFLPGAKCEGAALADASVTLNIRDGELHVMAAGTLASVPQTLTLGTDAILGNTTLSWPQEGQRKAFDIGVQSFNVLFVDSVSGATLFTLTAGKQGLVEFKFKLTTAFPRGQWVRDRVSVY